MLKKIHFKKYNNFQDYNNKTNCLLINKQFCIYKKFYFF